jgi:hypothetical protein
VRVFHLLAETEKIQDLRNDQLPFCCEVFWSKNHVQRKGHVLVNLGQTLAHQNVCMENAEECFGPLGMWETGQLREVNAVGQK